MWNEKNEWNYFHKFKNISSNNNEKKISLNFAVDCKMESLTLLSLTQL